MIKYRNYGYKQVWIKGLHSYGVKIETYLIVIILDITLLHQIAFILLDISILNFSKWEFTL